ncbi:hypothetical protein [Microbacterium aquilitoris]|uniref:hypothetical protein n=1 Tax=Microbacterium aquilitoris TaxID=3067307 RepID=UPI00288EE903|nr:hypothetical protein [Microbacterium sp. KSW2-22]MDT3343871.1 hypothetical protein [Microbacterium sp. KSW2-22]
MAPLAWHDHVDEGHSGVQALDAWLKSLVPFSRNHEQGEIDDLFDAASNGELWDSGDETTMIKPIREDPEIFELRRTALSKKLRFYHGEPAELPKALIKLHRHIKTTNSDQQAQIEHAAERYQDGRATQWN